MTRRSSAETEEQGPPAINSDRQRWVLASQPFQQSHDERGLIMKRITNSAMASLEIGPAWSESWPDTINARARRAF